MKTTIVLKSLKDIQQHTSIQNSRSSMINEADQVVIDWIDMEDPKVQSSLKELFVARQRQWESIEIRKCIGHCVPLMIRWIMEAAVTVPVQNLSLISVIDDDMANAIKNGLSSNSNHNKKGSPQFAELEILGSQLSPHILHLLFEGLSNNNNDDDDDDHSCPTTTTRTRTISFSNCNFVHESPTTLAEGINRCQHVQKLNLFSCRMADEDVAMLVNALRIQNHPLKHLDLGRNQCFTRTVKAIATWLRSPTIRLEYLNLSLQHLGFHTNVVVRLDPTPIFRELAQNQSLKALYLRGNRMDNGDGTCLDSLTQSLCTTNDTLETIMLTDCSLSGRAFDTLLQKICDFRGLRKLYLDGIQLYSPASNPQLSNIISEAFRRNQNTEMDEMHLPLSLSDQLLHTNLYLDRNFGGRRLVVNDGDNTVIDVLPALWPKIFERINKAALPVRHHYRRQPPKRLLDNNNNNNNNNKSREESKRRCDIMYYMIRENASLHHLLLMKNDR
eukprot:scaffold1223_cov119-Cylindrotheca_fusiformis.AAC.5